MQYSIGHSNLIITLSVTWTIPYPNLKLQDTSLIKQSYLFLKSDAEIGRSYNGTNWASHVKSMGLIIFGKNSLTCVSHLNLLNNVLPICICKNGTPRLTTHHVYKVTVSLNITITLKYIYIVSKNLNIELH